MVAIPVNRRGHRIRLTGLLAFITDRSKGKVETEDWLAEKSEKQTKAEQRKGT